MHSVTLVTGGARSGKSRFALELGARYRRPVFIATAEVTDPEMSERIDKHRQERGEQYATIEEPLNPARVLSLSANSNVDFILLDCLTVWLGNLMHYSGQDDEQYPEVQQFLEAIESPPCDMVIVTNELGMGIVPDNELSRWFRDVAGRLNQEVARRATDVVLMVSGCPLWVKTTSTPNQS